MVRRHDVTLVLDTGAVIGLSRGNARLRAVLDAAHRAGADVRVPMVVVAEATRGHGPRDAATNLVLHRLEPHPLLTEPTARRAGALLARAGTANTIDALVAAEAVAHAPAVVITGDVDDLRQLLLDEPTVRVELIPA